MNQTGSSVIYSLTLTCTLILPQWDTGIFCIPKKSLILGISRIFYHFADVFPIFAHKYIMFSFI